MSFFDNIGNSLSFVPTPFFEGANRFNYHYDDMRNGPLADEKVKTSPVYLPLARFGQTALSTAYGIVRTLADPSGPIEGSGPVNKIVMSAPSKKKPPGKNAAKNRRRRQNRKTKQGRESKESKRPFPMKRNTRNYPPRPMSKSLLSAPVAMGSIVPGVNYKFVRSRSYNCMRMIVHYFLGVIQIATTGALQFNITSSLGLVNNGGQWYFNPANTAYMSQCPFAVMSALFQKFYLMGLRLSAFTKVPTNTPGTISFGAVAEPAYFETGGTASATTNPTKLLVTQMDGSFSLPVWTQNWTVGFKVDPKQLYFLRSQSGTSSPYSYGDDVAEARQCYSHVAGFAYDGPAPSAALPIADIYLDLDIELCDFTSIFTNAPTLSLSSRLTKLEDRMNETDDEKILVVK
jgi:hypothetical protein